MKTEVKNIAYSIFGVIAFSLLGIIIFHSKAFQDAIERDPAAINSKSQMFSSMDSEKLKAELLKKIQIKLSYNSENQIEKAVTFSGFSSQACRTHEKIEMVFFSEGTSVDGEPTTMSVLADCLPGQDQSEIASIFIPIQKILVEKPRDAEFTFGKSNTIFKFTKASDQWPQLWVMKSIRFLGLKANTNERLITFDAFVSDSNAKQIVLEF